MSDNERALRGTLVSYSAKAIWWHQAQPQDKGTG